MWNNDPLLLIITGQGQGVTEVEKRKWNKHERERKKGAIFYCHS